MQESKTTERGRRVTGKKVRKKISKQRGDKKVIIKPFKKKKKVMKQKLIKEESINGGSEEDKGLSSDSGDGTVPASPKHLEVRSVDGADMQVPFFVQFDPDSHDDSRNAGRELFRLLINPFPLDDFFE